MVDSVCLHSSLQSVLEKSSELLVEESMYGIQSFCLFISNYLVHASQILASVMLIIKFELLNLSVYSLIVDVHRIVFDIELQFLQLWPHIKFIQ